MSPLATTLTCLATAGAGLIGLIVLGACRRVDEPEAEQRAHDWALGDHPDDTDPEPMTTADVEAMWGNALDGTPLPERRIRTRHLLADNDAPQLREVTQLRYQQCAFSEGYPVTVRTFTGTFYWGRVEQGYDTAEGFMPVEPLPTDEPASLRRAEIEQLNGGLLSQQGTESSSAGPLRSAKRSAAYERARQRLADLYARDGDNWAWADRNGNPPPDTDGRRAEWAEVFQQIADTAPPITWQEIQEQIAAEHAAEDARMQDPAFQRDVLGMWPTPTGDPNDELTAPQPHAGLDRIRAFAPQAVRTRCQVGMCCVNPDRLADRCVHGAYGDVPLGCPQIEGGDYRLTAEVKPVPNLVGVERDLPQWADTADHGPRTVSHWDQPAKRVNGSAL